MNSSGLSEISGSPRFSHDNFEQSYFRENESTDRTWQHKAFTTMPAEEMYSDILTQPDNEIQTEEPKKPHQEPPIFKNYPQPEPDSQSFDDIELS
jgi:hypothetical protein